MTPGCIMMLRTVAQVQGAMAETCFELASHLGEGAQAATRTLTKAAEAPLGAPAEERQTALEDAVWAAYVAHAQCLRTIAGVSSLTVLTFLNKLDQYRGDRPVRPGAAGGRSSQQ